MKNQDTLLCDGCGVEVTCLPYLVGRWIYCCEDCAQGYLCACAILAELEDEYRKIPSMSIE